MQSFPAICKIIPALCFLYFYYQSIHNNLHTEACTLENEPIVQAGDQVLIAFLPPLISEDGDVNPQSLLWMELIRFIVNKANENGTMQGNNMDNFTLGYMIYDTCNNIDMIVKHLLDIVLDDQTFLQRTLLSRFFKNCSILDDNEQHLCTHTYEKTTSAIAGTLLGVSAAISQHVIPVLTGLSHAFAGQNIHVTNFVTSDESIVSFTDQRAQSYVKSTATPDIYYAQAVLHFIQHLNWTYIGILYSINDESQNRAHLLLDLLSGTDICVGFNKLLKKDPLNIKQATNVIRSDEYATGIVIFASPAVTSLLLEEVSQRALPARTWIFGSKINHTSIRTLKLQQKGHHLLSLVPNTGRLPEFENYFWSLNSTKESPWLEAFFRYTVTNTRSVYNLGDFKHLFTTDDLGFLYNAVASHIAGASFLASNEFMALFLFVLSHFTTLSTPIIAEAIQYSSFTSLLGHKLRFNSQGLLGEYYFRMLDIGNGTTDGNDIYLGEWNTTDHWLLTDTELPHTIPVSSCAQKCPPGFQISPYKELHCCFTCLECPSNRVQYDISTDPCTECPPNSIANENHTDCHFLKTRYLHWHSSKGLSTIGLFAANLIFTVLVMFMFTIRRNTPVVRSSDTKLVTAQLFIHLLFCMVPALYFGEPTEATCVVRFFILFGLLTFQVSILLVKTERLLHIFAAQRRLKRRSTLYTLTVELFLVLLLISVGAAISFLYTVSEPIAVVYIDNEDNMLKDIYCKYSTHMLLQTAYIAVLTTVCFVHAFRARKLPNNFNETKFIMLSSFAWLSILLASAAIQVSLRNGEEKALVECIVAFLCNSSMLVILFGYKMWIISFKPSLNTLNYFQQQCFAASQKKVNDRLDSLPPSTEWSSVD